MQSHFICSNYKEFSENAGSSITCSNIVGGGTGCTSQINRPCNALLKAPLRASSPFKSSFKFHISRITPVFQGSKCFKTSFESIWNNLIISISHIKLVQSLKYEYQSRDMQDSILVWLKSTGECVQALKYFKFWNTDMKALITSFNLT